MVTHGKKLTISKFKSYYYLVKPGIVRANVMTAAAGFLFASKGNIDIVVLTTLLLGNALTIACGCILNNIIDRGIDSKMKRTEKRALVTGAISVRTALILAAVFFVAGSLLLWFFVNLITLLIGWWALFFYVVVYGYAKRETSYGTEVGSLPGAASIVAGYTAATAHIDTAAIILFLSMIFWQMPHFFSIAIFRAPEYKAAKIPVLPLKRGIAETKLRILGYTVLFVLASLSLYFYHYSSVTYLVVMAAASLYWLVTGIRGLNTPNPEKWARKMFGVSLLVLLAFSLVLSLDHWLP